MKIVMTVGLPRCGKSTWTKEQKGVPIVNPDSVRLAVHGERFNARKEGLVWWVVDTMIEALRHAGHDEIILDATNLEEKRRLSYAENYELEYVIFDTPVEECKRRALATNQADLVEVIDRMSETASIPTENVREVIKWR